MGVSENLSCVISQEAGLKDGSKWAFEEQNPRAAGGVIPEEKLALIRPITLEAEATSPPQSGKLLEGCQGVI